MQRRLEPRKLKLKGKEGWDSTFPLAHCGTGDVGDRPGNAAPDQPTLQHTAFFERPQCQKVEPSTCAAFQHIDLDKKQRCGECNHPSAVRLWKCKCGHRWHLCTLHKHKPPPNGQTATLLPSDGQPPPANNSKRKRSLLPSSFDEMLAADLRKAQRRKECLDQGARVITLGNCYHSTLRRSYLSPNLKSRFGDVGQV